MSNGFASAPDMQRLRLIAEAAGRAGRLSFAQRIRAHFVNDISLHADQHGVTVTQRPPLLGGMIDHEDYNAPSPRTLLDLPWVELPGSQVNADDMLGDREDPHVRARAAAGFLAASGALTVQMDFPDGSELWGHGSANVHVTRRVPRRFWFARTETLVDQPTARLAAA